MKFLLRAIVGLLKVGVPKKWDDSKKNLGYIRNAGVRQFISTYNRVKDLRGDELLWGDEIEYGIFHIDPETKKVRLSLRGKEVSFCRVKVDSYPLVIEQNAV
jgi:glutamate--cysteine ligase catalytic subunit